MSSDNLALARAKFLARAREQRRGNAPPQESRQAKHVAKVEHVVKREKRKRRERRSKPKPAGFESLADLARERGITVKQLYAAVTRGTLRVIRIGFFMYTTAEDVEDYLRLTRENLARTAKNAIKIRKEKAAARRAQNSTERQRSLPTPQGEQDD